MVTGSAKRQEIFKITYDNLGFRESKYDLYTQKLAHLSSRCEEKRNGHSWMKETPIFSADFVDW